MKKIKTEQEAKSAINEMYEYVKSAKTKKEDMELFF